MTGTVQKTSDAILDRLRARAAAMSRPDVRSATIDRLVEACNAIETGAAAATVKAALGTNGGLGLRPKITPTSIERYVRARGKRDRDWTGPIRVTIARDPDLAAYVGAREDERLKPAMPVRPSSHRRDVEDAISELPTIEMRMDLRHELESGRKARRQLELLTHGLRKIPAIDVDLFLQGKIGRPLPNDGSAAVANAGISDPEMVALKRLLERLTDREELARAGLEADGDRVRVAATRRALVKPDEMAALRRLVGV